MKLSPKTCKRASYPLLACISMLMCCVALGQNQLSPYYTAFDNAFGIANTGLYNGIEYREQFKGSNGKHKFSGSDEFKLGYVVYNGQPYAGVPLKYDVFNGELLLDLGNRYGINILQLNKSLVTEFNIDGANFINLETNSMVWEDHDYVEVFYNAPSFTLFKKHSKSKVERIQDKVSYVEFEDTSTFMIEIQDEYHEIRTKRDVIDLFPEHEKAIKNSIKGIKRKSNEDRYMLNMAKAIEPAKTLSK